MYVAEVFFVLILGVVIDQCTSAPVSMRII